MNVSRFHNYPEEGDRRIGLIFDKRGPGWVIDIGLYWKAFVITF